MTKKQIPLTDREGINAVEKIVLTDFKWFFREQPISDHGVDAQIEVLDQNGKPTGKLIALQIKSGASYFRKHGKDYVFYGDLRHLDYWTNHSLPCYIILHNPEIELTLWQKVERRLAKLSDANWSIIVPADNIFDIRAKRYFENEVAADPEAIRRFNMAFDRDTIELFSKQTEMYFAINDWVNKTLNMRDVDVFFDEETKDEPDLIIPLWAPTSGYADFMNRYFPWLDFELIETEETMSAEVEVHKLHVWVNDLGKAYLTIEDYFKNGRPEPVEPLVSDPDFFDELDDE